MENGTYYISMDKNPGETYYLQYLDGLFMLGSSGSTGDAAGQFRVTVSNSQVSMHVTINSDMAGYVNSFEDGGGFIKLHLGDAEEFFNITEDGDGYQIWREETEDGSTFQAYFTGWSNEDDHGVYMDRENARGSQNDRAVQKWKFTAVTVEDIVIDSAHQPHGG